MPLRDDMSAFLFHNMLDRGDPGRWSSAGLSRELSFGAPRPIQVESADYGTRKIIGTVGLESKYPKICPDSYTKPKIPRNTMANGQEQNGVTK